MMRMDSRLKRLLDECGLPWSLEPRRRHYMIVLAGRPVQVLSRGAIEKDGRHQLNALAHVRRCIQAARGAQASPTRGVSTGE